MFLIDPTDPTCKFDRPSSKISSSALSLLVRFANGPNTKGSLTASPIWAIVEINMSVFCACMITILPALRRLLPERLLRWLSGSVISLFPGLQKQSIGFPDGMGGKLALTRLSLDDSNNRPERMEEGRVLALKPLPGFR